MKYAIHAIIMKILISSITLPPRDNITKQLSSFSSSQTLFIISKKKN